MGWSNVVDNETLRTDAGNLAPFLVRIARDNPEHFARISETVRQVAPFFGALRRLPQHRRASWQVPEKAAQLVSASARRV